MCFQVTVEGRLDRKRAVTLIAGERLLPGVYADVPHEVARLLEALGTVGALVGVLAVLCHKHRLLLHDAHAALLCRRLDEDLLRHGHRLIGDGLTQLLRLLLTDLDDGGATPLHLLLRVLLRL